jgi:hypothetical protein
MGLEVRVMGLRIRVVGKGLALRLIETKVPAIQAVQVEDELAPVMAEYVPAKASDEEECVSRFEDKRLCEHVKGREDGGMKRKMGLKLGLRVRVRVRVRG